MPFYAFALHVLLVNVKAQALVDLMNVKAMGSRGAVVPAPSQLGHSTVLAFDSTRTCQGLGFMLGVTANSKHRGHFVTQWALPKLRP